MGKLYAIQAREIIGAVRKEGWAFLFICLYLIFEYVRPQAIYTQIDFLPWVPIVILFAVLSLLSNSGNSKSPNMLNKLMVIYAVVVLLSSSFSQFPSISFARWRSFFDWFIIYFLVVTIVNNEKRFFVFLLLFLICSFKMSQHGFISWASRGFAYKSWGVSGAPGWFHNSGEVGIQMCIYVPLAVAFIFGVYKNLSKLWFVFFLLMPFTGITTVIASSSRGALVGLAFASVRILFMRFSVLLRGVILFSFITLIGFHFMPEESIQRFENSGLDRTSQHRLERWRDGIEAMNKFPLFGVGFEAWSEFYPANFELEDEGTLLVHNIFVQCGSELGYTGLSIFLLMILGCFVNTSKVRNICKNSEDRFLFFMSYGFDAALLGFLASGFFVTVLYYPYFWIHCAMTVSLYSAASNRFTRTNYNDYGKLQKN